MAKTTLKTYNKFLDDYPFWGEDTYCDEVTLTVNGIKADNRSIEEPQFKPEHEVIIESGFIADHETLKKGFSFAKFFELWLDKETHTTISVKVPKDRVVEFNALLEEHGFKPEQ